MSETGWTCRQCKAPVAGPYAACVSCGDKPERATPMTRKITVTGTGYDPALGRSVRDPTLPESREDRCRRMVMDPKTWPGGRLRMKKIVNDSIVGFGMVSYPAEYPLGYIMIHIDEPDPAEPGYLRRRRNLYADIDELIADGWVVD